MSAAIRSRCRASSPARPRASPSSIRSRSRARRISARRAPTNGPRRVLTVRERHHRRGQLRGVRRRSTTCCASTAPPAASKCRTSGSPAARAIGGLGKIDIIRSDGTRETISVNEQRHLYSFEADAAAEAIRAGKQEFAAPGMSWADTPRQRPRARQVARRCRPRIRHREAGAAHAHALRPQAQGRRHRDRASARIPGVAEAGFGRRAGL